MEDSFQMIDATYLKIKNERYYLYSNGIQLKMIETFINLRSSFIND